MVKRHSIPVDDFACPPFHLWGERWLLLVSGRNEARQFNCMTVAWGGFGMMWAKPFAMVAVRPSRYTYGFMEKAGDFTLCAFPPSMKDKLTVCGTQSGRDIDKVAVCGFHPVQSASVGSPGFDEAELIVECRTLYAQDLDPRRFISPDIEKVYSGRDYHRFYYGEILAISGTHEYARHRARHA